MRGHNTEHASSKIQQELQAECCSRQQAELQRQPTLRMSPLTLSSPSSAAAAPLPLRPPMRPAKIQDRAVRWNAPHFAKNGHARKTKTLTIQRGG
jgi:hypothetical protein